MSQVTEQSVRFQTALASIKLIQASAVLDLTEDDFDFLTSNKVWIATDRSRSEERFSRNAETDLVCRLLLEKKKKNEKEHGDGQYCDTQLKLPPHWLQHQPVVEHANQTRGDIGL